MKTIVGILRKFLAPQNAKPVFISACVAFILNMVLLFSGSFDFDNWKYKVLSTTSHAVASIPVVSGAGGIKALPAFINPAAAEKDGPKTAEIEFDFNPKTFAGSPNLFQTAPYNKGLRMEFSPDGTLSLVVSRGAGEVPEDRALSCRISTGTWHHAHVTLSPDREIKVDMDGVRNVIPSLKGENINLDFSRITAGYGFSEERLFSGQIRNFSVRYSILTPRQGFRVLLVLLFAIKLVLALVPLAALAYFAWSPGATLPVAPGAAWPQALTAVMVVLSGLFSSLKYLFITGPALPDSILEKLVPDFAFIRLFELAKHIKQPEFYLWGIPFLALIVLLLFLSRHSRPGALLVFSTLAVILSGIAGQLPSGAVTLLLLIASYGIGSQLCALLGQDSSSEQFALPLTLGISLNGIAFWTAAHFKINYPVTHFFFLLLELLFAYRPLWRLIGRWYGDMARGFSIGQLAILCFAVFSLPYALMPAVGWDGQVAHVYIAKYISLYGYFDFSPFYPYGLDQAIIPKGIYSPLYMLGGLGGIKIFNWLLFAVSFWIVEKFARERFNSFTSFIAVLVCALVPSVLWQTYWVFIDVFELFFCAVLLAHFFRTMEHGSWRNLLLFFSLSAFSYYGKQGNAILVIPLTFILGIRPFAQVMQSGSIRPAGRFLLSLLICPVLLAPLLWLNYHATGNPLFPYFNSIFKSFYFPLEFDAIMYAPLLDPWRLLSDITFHGSKTIYYAFSETAFGTWFFVFLPVSLWVVLFDNRNRRDAFILSVVFLMSSFLFLYLLSPQLRYFDSCLPAGAVLLGLGINSLFELVRLPVLRTAMILVVSSVAAVNLLAEFTYTQIGIQYPLRYLMGKEQMPNHPYDSKEARTVMEYAGRTYGKYAKGLLYYSPVMSMADFRVETYDWYNYRMKRELLSAKTPEVLYDIIFRINKFDFLILTDRRPKSPLDLLVTSGFVVPEFHVDNYTLYRPAHKHAGKVPATRIK